MLFADVILPLAVERNYTFGVPVQMQDKIKIGCRVEVQFGKRKVYSGIVKTLHQNKPDVYEVKPIRTLLDDEPIVTEQQLKFWEWMASYYACTQGEVMNAALPSHLKLVSETYVVLNPDIDINSINVTDDEYLVLQALEIRQQQKEAE
jgi:primosomal protein N' (replication factor Y)